jgi:hypothetical protein
MALIVVILVSWNISSSIKAQADLNALLVTYGQTPVPLWRSVIRGSPRERVLIAGQLASYEQDRYELMAQIKYVENQPAGWHVPVNDPDAVDGSSFILKDDWLLLEATQALAKLEAQIAALK